MVQSLFASAVAPLAALVFLATETGFGALGQNLRNDPADPDTRNENFNFRMDGVHPDDLDELSSISLYNNATGRRTADMINLPQESLCGASKRSLEEDGIRRNCLRQCRIDNGQIRPTFSEWEKFCRDTAGMEEWDSACYQYFCCTFGCDIYGGDRDICRNVAVAGRRNLIVETQADLLQGITQEQRCEMQKCHSYCARISFDTCRETMFREACEGSNPHLYSCDVTCNGASRMRPLAVLLAALVALGWSGRSMQPFF